MGSDGVRFRRLRSLKFVLFWRKSWIQHESGRVVSLGTVVEMVTEAMLGPFHFDFVCSRSNLVFYYDLDPIQLASSGSASMYRVQVARPLRGVDHVDSVPLRQITRF